MTRLVACCLHMSCGRICFNLSSIALFRPGPETPHRPDRPHQRNVGRGQNCLLARRQEAFWVARNCTHAAIISWFVRAGRTWARRHWQICSLRPAPTDAGIRDQRWIALGSACGIFPPCHPEHTANVAPVEPVFMKVGPAGEWRRPGAGGIPSTPVHPFDVLTSPTAIAGMLSTLLPVG